MNFVFISPHFPSQYFHFATALRERGVTVLGIGDTPYESLRQELRESLREYFFVPSLTDYDALVRATGYLTWRHGRMDRIESLNESWLEVEARLREDFHVPGLQPSDILKLRSKSGMAEVFHASGVPHPDLLRVRDADQVKEFAARVGYPLVLKPDVGVGAAHTFKVASDAEVDAALAHPLPTSYVAQPFVRGTIVTYDGIVDRHGVIVFNLSHEYSDGGMETVTERRDISFWSLQHIPAALDVLGRQVVAAFGLRERWFHLEFFRLPDGRFVVLEANLRPPGGFMTDMMNYTCDIDVYRLYARVVTGDPVADFQYTPRHHVCHSARRHGRRYKHSHAQIVERLGKSLLVHRELPPIYHSLLGEEMYLTRHTDTESMQDAVRFIQAT
ncbi:ATP-grasp domain-containing protein [Corallococcus exiguus]|uniref:ATP-grasp domain-containing protein n=1 Tax=Corallococcus TaxID=83461 RepID=UPI000EE31B07|nr:MULTISPECIES: ATP-grasp domain-containing protein [Corallococcus]NNC16447.1 ATP-grasp domain-containing protein [Corallococcus exiguus]RKI06174.1 ATP-grasp domain-containing protein [Corallococcus sp. AB030]RUO89476.1 ATP-grasp domain-containing protein [Corallococcus sp. AB018]